MKRRVVITGLGAVSGFGVGLDVFWENLKAGRSAIRPLSPEIPGVNVAVGAMVPNYDPSEYFTSEQLTLLDRFSQFAVIASQQAIQDAGLVTEGVEIANAAAIIGSACGGKHTDEDTYSQLYKQKRTRAHPLTIPKGMPSAAASCVSIHCGIKGPVFSIASACASGAHAVIQAASMIQSGMVDVAVAGAADAPFTYGLLKSWEALRVMSNDTCRPFSRDRSGIVLGEGAGMLVLESDEHARNRGARIYSELTGYGMTSDAGHITRPSVQGIVNAMRNALINSNMNPDEVDYINAHGTGTQLNDAAESDAIRQVFGKRIAGLKVSSSKSMHGHALGASSALELITSVLAIYKSIAPPTVNFTDADEGNDIDFVPNMSCIGDVNIAMSNSFAFGGLNASVAMKKYTYDRTGALFSNE